MTEPKKYSWIMENAQMLITLCACAVTIDVYAGATGDADPFPVLGFPLFAALRGVVLTLALTYALGKVRAMLRAEKRNHKVLVILGALTLGLLFCETVIIAPFILAKTLGVNMAQMLVAFNVFGIRFGALVLIAWSVVVALVSTLSVATSAIATFVAEDASNATTKMPTTTIVSDNDVTMPRQERLADIRRANSERNGDGALSAAEIVARYGVSLRQAQRDVRDLASVV